MGRKRGNISTQSPVAATNKRAKGEDEGELGPDSASDKVVAPAKELSFATGLRELVCKGSSDADIDAWLDEKRPTPPSIQKLAPNFIAQALLPNKEFKEISLSDYQGKWVIFFWYPLDFTFVCPTEIIAFGDRADEFATLNAQVIAASCDSQFSHLAWVNTPRSEGGLGNMKIPIISDYDKSIAAKYGVLLDGNVPLRALFIISPTGILRQITCNDLPVGRNVDEIIRLLKAFQYTDVHGEVCPANWQPGDLTMHADPVKSKEYFTAIHK